MDLYKIKEIRKEKGLSQQDLGDKLNVSGAYIQQIESNKKNPSLKTLKRIASALDTNFNYLISSTSYDTNKTVLLDEGFFTLDDIKTPFSSKEHIANLIKYKIPKFDLTTLSDDDWNIILKSTLDSLEYELYKLKK